MMLSKRGRYDRAGAWLIFSGILHFKLLFVMGFTSQAAIHVGIALVWFLSAVGCFRGWRWLVWLLYIPVMADAIYSMALSLEATGLMAGWYAAIAVIDVFALIAVFIGLWRNPQVP